MELTARVLAVTCALFVAGCAFDEPDPMGQQPRSEAYRQSAFFDDRRDMRVPPEHLVLRDRDPRSREVREGVRQGRYLDRIPVPVTRDLLIRGRDRFDVFCATCHGLLGDGASPVARQMTLRPPPSLIHHQPHEAPTDAGVAAAAMVDRHPHFAPGHVYSVISHGYGLMSSYASELTVDDRWAVVAYLEALRLSQAAQVSRLPAPVQQQLAEAAP